MDKIQGIQHDASSLTFGEAALINVDDLKFGTARETDADGARAIIKWADQYNPKSIAERINKVKEWTSEAHDDSDAARLRDLAVNALRTAQASTANS